jgi:hypothetical protein
MTLTAMSRREAGIVASLVDAVAAPGGALPPASRTDAVSAFDALLARVPALNRIGLRALLWMIELRPAVGGWRRRLHRLEPAERDVCLDALERGLLGLPVEGLLALAKLAYFGDAGVMRALGYDADAVVARGRALRTAEERW